MPRMQASDSARTEHDTRQVAQGAGVRSWPWVSLNIPPEQLAEFTDLAARLGRSRADLLREVLEFVGLPYARAIAANRGGASPRARREVHEG